MSERDGGMAVPDVATNVAHPGYDCLRLIRPLICTELQPSLLHDTANGKTPLHL